MMEINHVVNKSKIHYVNSHAEGEESGRYLLTYQNEPCVFDENGSVILPDTQFCISYFVEKNSLSKGRINQIRKDFQQTDYNHLIKEELYDEFLESINNLDVDLYVFDERAVKKNIEYSNNGLKKIDQLNKST